ncbi:response regulator [Flavobacterium franklandianum]|uniref:histidine kinase n=2 Tax=Flavobacterium TaxID=237 RepID=A0A553CLD6_9FLAO|nr:hybrid sensor histidine kinase/response regulator transcription factor [Flavobacterium franklandianum]TRX21267.1 response regulator [Flavobacterium franklandianum]TRX30084.1 response regulator [Flavobacterium franklandianum]
MNKFILNLLLLFFFTQFLLGQEFYFKHYKSENGLSHNTVLSSLQDKKGFMWFGTKDGLNRFDGYTFKTFRNDTNIPKSIGSNFIECLHEYNGQLWVGTNNGLFQYNEKSEDFSLLHESLNKPIVDIENDADGNLWYIADLTLFKYNIASKKTVSFKNTLLFNVEEISKTPKGNIWVAFNNNLFGYSKETNTFNKIEINIKTKNKLPIRISKIVCENENTIYIGTQNSGVIVYDVLKNSIKRLRLNTEEPLYVRDFLKINADELWIATESGLILYNLKNATYKNLTKSYNNPYALSDNAVYTLTADSEGGVWIGTYFGGINYYPKQYIPFKKYFPKLGENSISGNAVREIRSDHYGNLWIGTEDAGLNKYNPNTGIFTNYNPSKSSNHLSHNNIHGLLLQANTLWVGTFDRGIDLLDIATGKVIKHYSVGDGHGLSSNFVYTLYQNKLKQIIVITSTGIQTYNTEEDTFISHKGFPEGVFYTSFLEDKKGNLWAGTYWDGIICYNPSTNQRIVFKQNKNNSTSISNNGINGIFQDYKNDLWIATENGLNVYNYKGKGFKKYTTKDGFPSNVFYSIIEGEKNILWISTSKGLVEFNQDTKKIKVYTEDNGLLNNQFNYNSAYKDKNGTIYFGSTSGMIAFNPKKFIKNTYRPSIFITGIEIISKEASESTNISALNNSITNHNEIILQPDENSFNLDFTSLSYTAPEMVEYWFQLDGSTNDWISLGKRHKVYFTGLSSGTYDFKVKALNVNGTWSKSLPLQITILPPFWKSNLAYVFYFLILIGLSFLGFRFYHNRIKTKNMYLINELNNKKEKELYNAKIEFFTNISHEIRTPLSLIKSPLEKLLEKVDLKSEIRENLSIMDKNVSRLLHLVSQLLDFRKTELESVSLTFVKTNISNLIRETHTQFSQIIDSKNIDFELKMETENLIAYVDVEVLTKILSNLFNNAIKYSKSNIILSLTNKEGYFKLTIKNDGKLIPPHLRNKIFEPFFRAPGTENQSGTGIGLALAYSLVKLHKGTLKLDTSDAAMNSFVLKLPLHQEKEFDFFDSEKSDIKEDTALSMHKFQIENNKPTLLLIEDNEDLLDFIAKDLMENYTILKSSNAIQALEIVDCENIQLVISDVMMPEMDGFNFCEKMKTNINTSHIPIILLTAKTSIGARIEGLESGADAYIDKPFSMEYLKVQVSNLLENRKNIIEHYSSSPLAHIRTMAHTSVDEKFIKKLDEIIIRNISDSNLSVDTLAENMNMSRSTLYRKINSISNLSPNDLINITRLKKAAELLKTGNYKIYEIAEMVGFNSQVSFGRSFHRQFNMTPSEYVKFEIKKDNK